MSFRLRLYPDDAQLPVLEMHCRHARRVWNIGPEQRNHWRPGVFGARLPRLGMAEQAKSLAEARRHSYLGRGSSAVQQQALRDLDRAFRAWWSNPTHFRRPRFRSAKRDIDGFAIRDLTINRLGRHWGEVLVPKAGRVRFRIGGRSWSQLRTATSARVTRDRTGRWWVSLTAPQPAVARQPTGAVVGLDMGVAATVTTSDGAHLRMPDTLTPGEKTRQVRLQRRLARQQQGSKRRERTRRSLARLSRRQADRRKDWIEQATTRLARDHDLIGIENLKVTNMVRRTKPVPDPDRPGVFLPNGQAAKSGLNRSIHQQAWSLFRQRLTDKASAATDPDGTPRPVVVVAVNPAKTSQTCSVCGDDTPTNRESQAVYRCADCGQTSNADVNAAINIRNLALTEAGPAPGHGVNGRGGDIRPTLVGNPNEASTSPAAATPRNPRVAA